MREKAELELNSKNELLGGFGTVQDITERKKMEEELRKSHDELEIKVQERTEELFRTNEELIVEVAERKKAEEALRSISLYTRNLIESSLDPLVTISADGKIMDVNDATVKVTGVGRDQLIGTDFSNYFTEPEKARKGYRRFLQRVLSRTSP